jgi:hypothetical protein
MCGVGVGEHDNRTASRRSLSDHTEQPMLADLDQPLLYRLTSVGRCDRDFVVEVQLDIGRRTLVAHPIAGSEPLGELLNIPFRQAIPLIEDSGLFACRYALHALDADDFVDTTAVRVFRSVEDQNAKRSADCRRVWFAGIDDW